MSISSSSGYRLQAHVIRTILVTSPVECGQYCLLEQRCESLNYFHPITDEYKSACELNNSTKEKNKEDFEENTKTTYYHLMTQVTLSFPGPCCCARSLKALELIIPDVQNVQTLQKQIRDFSITFLDSTNVNSQSLRSSMTTYCYNIF